MDDSRDFDLLTSPCEGTSLIEASAGTGKTYAITGLALRLMLEKKLLINEILVVTFTEAATNELKDRIRRRLREALAWFCGRQPPKIRSRRALPPPTGCGRRGEAAAIRHQRL